MKGKDSSLSGHCWRRELKKTCNLVGTASNSILPELSLAYCLREAVIYKNVFRDIKLNAPSCSR